MIKKIIITIALLVVFSVGSQASDWANFRKDSLHSARSTELLQPPLSVKWTFNTGDKIISSASVVNGKVYFGSRDNNLYALDARSGNLLWKFTTEGWVDSSPAVVNDMVYFSSRDGNLYCLNAQTGQLLWKFTTGGTDCSSPVVSEDTVFCASGAPNKFIYALDAQTGTEIWRTDTDQMVYSSPALKGDRLYIGSNDGHIYCINKDTGQLSWKYHTRGGIYFSSPAIDDSRLYLAAGNFDWSVYALQPDSGQLLWQHIVEDRQPTPTYVSSPAIGEDAVFIVSGYANQYLYCLNSSNGTLKWKAELGPSIRFGFDSSPCVTEDIVYVVSAEGKLCAFEITTGRLVWSYDLVAKVLSSVTVANGVLYISTLDGNLIALEQVS